MIKTLLSLDDDACDFDKQRIRLGILVEEKLSPLLHTKQNNSCTAGWQPGDSKSFPPPPRLVSQDMSSIPSNQTLKMALTKRVLL